MNKILIYLKFFFSFIVSQIFSVWGQFYTLKFPNLSMLKAFAIAIPFAWSGWVFLTYSIDISHMNNLFTPMQNIFTLIMTQFGLALLLNKFYLNKYVNKSDLIGFLLILVAFAISYEHLISKTFGLEIPKAHEESKLN